MPTQWANIPSDDACDLMLISLTYSEHRQNRTKNLKTRHSLFCKLPHEQIACYTFDLQVGLIPDLKQDYKARPTVSRSQRAMNPWSWLNIHLVIRCLLGSICLPSHKLCNGYSSLRWHLVQISIMSMKSRVKRKRVARKMPAIEIRLSNILRMPSIMDKWKQCWMESSY